MDWIIVMQTLVCINSNGDEKLTNMALFMRYLSHLNKNGISTTDLMR